MAKKEKNYLIVVVVDDEDEDEVDIDASGGQDGIKSPSSRVW